MGDYDLRWPADLACGTKITLELKDDAKVFAQATRRSKSSTTPA
jgi:HSP90 family molecular chaperone